MKGPFRCSDCEHMGLMGRARLTSGTSWGGPRGECWCKHPEAEASFAASGNRSAPCFIAFTAPGGSTPAIKTSPRWCPLKRPGATRSPGKGPSTGWGEVMPTKKKRLTRREKAERAAMKKELQARGVLPPDKPRLDRKKFARETWAEFEALYKAKPIRAELALIKAVGFMVGPEMHRVTPEEVGVLKLLKLAVEYDGFLDKLEAEGRETYTTGELVDEVVLPIIKL